MIHGVALKHLNHVGDLSSCVKLSGSSSGTGGLTTTEHVADDEEGVVEQEGNEEEEENDEHILNPQPFAALFQRMKPVDTRKRTAEQKPPKPSKNAKTTKGAGGGGGGGAGGGGGKRKREGGGGGGGAGEDDEFRLPAPVPTGQEDKVLIESYETQLRELSELQPPSADDQGFVPWAKQRMNKLSELKAGLSS